MLKQLNKKRSWEQRMREQHRCVTCGKAAKYLRCESCLEKLRIYHRKLRQKRQEAGNCILCGKKVEAGFKYCNRNECIPARKLRQ